MEIGRLIELSIKFAGIPATLMLTLVWCLFKGYLITGREAVKDREACQLHIRRLELQVMELKEEKKMWIKTALNATHVAEKAVEKVSTPEMK
jgi:hypothetical protein